MFVVKMRDDATNKRVVSSVGWWSLPEPSGSGFSCVFGLNHSDSAAHAKHSAQSVYNEYFFKRNGITDPITFAIK